MPLTFSQKLSLENGSVVFYHEGKLQSGEDFHVLILVRGKSLENYFKYIAEKENFAVGELQSFGQILHCDIGSMSDDDIEKSIGLLAK